MSREQAGASLPTLEELAAEIAGRIDLEPPTEPPLFPPLRVTLIASRWHRDLVNRLVLKAVDTLLQVQKLAFEIRKREEELESLSVWKKELASSLSTPADMIEVRQSLGYSGSPALEFKVLQVPGAMELPLAAQWACRRYNSESVTHGALTLGVLFKGETAHFDLVARACADGVQRVSLDESQPVLFGVLALDDEAQFAARADLPEIWVRSLLAMMLLRQNLHV